jgi:hypothetical protein
MDITRQHAYKDLFRQFFSEFKCWYFIELLFQFVHNTRLKFVFVAVSIIMQTVMIKLQLL